MKLVESLPCVFQRLQQYYCLPLKSKHSPHALVTKMQSQTVSQPASDGTPQHNLLVIDQETWHQRSLALRFACNQPITFRLMLQDTRLHVSGLKRDIEYAPVHTHVLIDKTGQRRKAVAAKDSVGTEQRRIRLLMEKNKQGWLTPTWEKVGQGDKMVCGSWFVPFPKFGILYLVSVGLAGG